MPEDAPKGGRKPAAPRLIVRRDAHRELEFRYDPEERLSRGTAPRRTAGGQSAGAGSFLKNRTHRLLLLNVALILAVALVGLLLLGNPGDRARIGPFEARLQAMPFEGSVYVTLSLRYTGRPGPRASAERFTVRFLLEPGGETISKEAALPAAPGGQVTVGEALPLGSATRVRAELQLGDRRRTLARDFRR
jgi:hypothetical protein